MFNRHCAKERLQNIVGKLISSLASKVLARERNYPLYGVPEDRNRECRQRSKSSLPPYERRLRGLLENWRVCRDRSRREYRNMQSQQQLFSRRGRDLSPFAIALLDDAWCRRSIQLCVRCKLNFLLCSSKISLSLSFLFTSLFIIIIIIACPSTIICCIKSSLH